MSDSDIEEIKPEPKQNVVFSGIFSALNVLNQVEKNEEKKGSFVNANNLPGNLSCSLFERKWSEFVQPIGGIETLLFNPIKLYPRCKEFSSNITLSESAMDLIKRGADAYVFCVRDSDDIEPFWPAHFSFSINSKLYEAPSWCPPYSAESFWVDISSSIKSEYVKLHVYSNRAMSSTPYFLIGMLMHQKSNAEIISSITKHKDLANWQRIYTLSDPSDDDIRENCLTIQLYCPLGQGKIKIPIRGEKCEHLSCFDANSYLKFQRFSGTWKCPTCGKDCPLEDVYIDDVFHAILSACDKDLEYLKVNYQGIPK